MGFEVVPYDTETVVLSDRDPRVEASVHDFGFLPSARADLDQSGCEGVEPDLLAEFGGESGELRK